MTTTTAPAPPERAPTTPRTIDVARVPVDALDLPAVLARVDGFVRSGRPHYNVAINAAKVVDSQHDGALRDSIRDAHLRTADGQAVVWAARLLGGRLPARLAGADLMEVLLAHAAARGYAVYFLGARPEIVRACVTRAQARHPALVVAGYRDGYFGADDEPAIIAAIRDARPDLLFLGFGTPAKEYFMHRHHQAMGVPFVMGVGGTFDVFAGVVRRAPVWMQRTGLEWAYRLAQEPRRMWRRYLVGNTRFVALVARDWLDRRRA